MKKTLVMLGTASVLALSAATAAHAGTITGRVTDASATIGLQGATIRVVETGRTVTVGRDGTYRLSGLDAGTYTLRASYVGAESREFTVTLGSVSDVVSQNITLGDDVAFIENILVVGQRGALNSALSRQRADDGLVTVLSADAIGQFPDENVAEAARRAVGVNVLNDQGEGRFVSIRGIDPNLVSTSVNGVRLTSPEAEDRQVGLDVIDSDVLSSVVINKSLLPSMPGDSVGGNVEIETQSGLDVDELTWRAKVGGLYSDLENAFGYRASANFADNFFDGRLGVAASLSHQEREFGSENIEIDGKWDEEDGIYFPEEVEQRDYQVTRERTTAAVNLDYAHSDTLSFYLRTIYSDFSDQEYRSRIETKLEDGAFDDANSTANLPIFIADDELGVDRDVKDRLETQLIYAADFGGEWLFNDTTIDFSLSYVHSEEEEPNRLDTDFKAEFGNNELIGVDVSNPLHPVLIPAGGASTQAYFDPSNYELDAFEVTNGLSEDDELAVSANIRHDFDAASYPVYVQGGFSYRIRDKKYDQEFQVFEWDGAGDPTLADFATTTPYGLGNLGPIGDPGAIRTFVRDNAADLELQELDSTIESFVADYGADEDVMSFYAMGGGDFGPLRIVGGVRVEETEYEAYGYQVFLAEEDATVGGVVLGDDTSFIDLVTTSNDYTDVLPSLNVRYEVSEDVVARFAYYDSIQRPNPSQTAPRAFIEQNDDDEVEGEFGNPDLDRLEATNFDASIEWYPNNDAVVYVGYFYKDLENVIGTRIFENETVNGITFDEATSYVNLPEGSVSGIEFNYQQDLDFLPVEGFIAGFNLTYSGSEATLDDGRVVDLPRQSDTVWNAILGYDQGPWDLRAALSHRSEFLDEIGDDAGEDRIVLEHTQLDLSGRYRFSDHVQFYLDVKNITDEPFTAVTRPDGIDRLQQFEEYGWSTTFGFRLRG